MVGYSTWSWVGEKEKIVLLPQGTVVFSLIKMHVFSGSVILSSVLSGAVVSVACPLGKVNSLDKWCPLGEVNSLDTWLF